MTTENIAPQLTRGYPASLTVVSTKARVLRGTKQLIPAGVSTVVPLPRGPGRVIAYRDYLAFSKAGEMAAPADAPTITSFTPTTVDNDDTTVVTITGTGFEVSATVTLVDSTNGNGLEIPAGNVTRVSATSITFTVPTAVLPDVYYVRVSDANVDVIATQTLTATAPLTPTITSFTPSTVDNDDTAIVTITGTNFATNATVTLIDSLNVATAAGHVIRVSATSITFTVPAARATGNYSVRVANAYVQTTAASLLTVT